VSAVPDPGYYLDSWELDNAYVRICNPLSVNMNENHTLQAMFKPLNVGHNIATKWVASKTVVGQGLNLSVQVTVLNTGSYAENFSVTAYLSSTQITPQNITLDSGAYMTLTFTMNTSSISKGNYTIWAYSSPLFDETETADNNCTGGWVLVARVGDLNGDDKCDGRDLIIGSRAFGSYGPDYYYPGSPATLGWNANADITDDNKVDGRDLIIMSRHFGEGT